MSFIAIAPKGTDKYSDFFIDSLKEASKISTDGVGYAFKRHDESGLFFSKGMFTFDQLLNKLQNHAINLDDELVIHFRKGCIGGRTALNCHPFILANTLTELESIGEYKTYNNAFFHSGYFTDYSTVSYAFSDSYGFARDFLRNLSILEMLKDDKEKFLQTFDSIIGNNKFVIMDYIRDKPIITVGDFIEDKGYSFSNDTYKNNPINTNIAPYNSVYNVNMDDCINYPIPISASNYHEVSLICKKDCNILKCTVGEKWIFNRIPQLNSNSLNTINLATNPSKTSQAYMREIYENFTIVPNIAYKDKYMQYFTLKKNIAPTMSSIKKIHNKVKNFYKDKGFYPSSATIFSTEYKNRTISSRYDVLAMFLVDNFEYIRGDEIFVPGIYFDTKLHNYLVKHDNLKKEEEDNNWTNIVKKNEEIVKESLDKFKKEIQEKEKQLEESPFFEGWED